MHWVAGFIAVGLIVVVLIDAFEAVILPRRVAHRYRIASNYYRAAWKLWSLIATALPERRWRTGFLGVFGPISLFGLLSIWATALIVGFGLLHWSLASELHLPTQFDASLSDYMYFSGTTFFTLGYGDIVPVFAVGRFLGVFEAGLGFGFLAVVVGYLPVLYQSFSRREIAISLLDARAGSPPSAGELLRRATEAGTMANIDHWLSEWERWSAELLESHLSYPVLSYYRSQHDNQSWVAALTTILDTSALLIAAIEEHSHRQARLTFAMARHAAVDLGLIAHTAALEPLHDRLPPEAFQRLYESLRQAGLPLREASAAAVTLRELRGMYEPFVFALATTLRFSLPAFEPKSKQVDNWQTSAWMPVSPGLTELARQSDPDDHFA
jgi:hypothetical protein